MANPMTIKMKKRLNIGLGIIFALFLGYIIFNLVKITIVDADMYQEFAANQQLSTQDINANRGTIYDTNMNVLAQSGPVWTIVISPNEIKAEEERRIVYNEKAKANAEEGEEVTLKNEDVRGEVAANLAEILEVDAQMILGKIERDSQYEVIKEEVEKAEADEVRQYMSDSKMYAISLIEDTKRYYPNNELASQVIGFIGKDNTGLYGVELFYDEILQGTSGKVLSAKDGWGNEIPTDYEQRFEPVNGKNIVLTIDESIQHFTEKALNEVVQQHKPAEGATAIVMDINTGAILAMANSYTYDLNNPFDIYSADAKALYDASAATMSEEELANLRGELQLEQWSNKAISDVQEPGSVFKVITASAALEAGTSTWNDTFYCTGHTTVLDTTMNCNNRSGHGSLSFTDAIVYSCNPSFIEIGTSLGATNFYNYFEMFGLTEKTGIDLPGEGNSVYLSESQLRPVELASSSFGQTNAVSALQMITAVAAVANGGYLVTPHVLQEVVEDDGTIIDKNEPQIKRQVISEQVSAEMALAMEKMVAANGGSTAYVQGYRIGGKSGTSQKANQDGIYISTFAAFAPVDDPQIAVIVIVDEPTQGKYYGSVVAGPAVGAIMADTLPYIGVSPEYSEEILDTLETQVDNMIAKTVDEAKQELTAKGLNVVVMGEGATVIDQMPREGQSVADGSKIILYTQEGIEQQHVAVPNVIGMTPTAAKAALDAVGLNMSLSSGEKNPQNKAITEQNIAQDTMVPVGSVVVVDYTREVAEGLG